MRERRERELRWELEGSMWLVWGVFFFFFQIHCAMILVVASHKLLPRVCRFNLPPELSLHHGQLQQRQHSEAVVPHTPHLPPAAQHCHRPAVGEDHWKHRCQSRASCTKTLWNPTLTRWPCVSADTAMVPGSPPLLCGKVSRDIKQELDKLSIDIRAKKLRWFSECISVISPSQSSGLVARDAGISLTLSVTWKFYHVRCHHWCADVGRAVGWLGRLQHLRRASSFEMLCPIVAGQIWFSSDKVEAAASMAWWLQHEYCDTVRTFLA